jgi:hypothetical protein
MFSAVTGKPESGSLDRLNNPFDPGPTFLPWRSEKWQAEQLAAKIFSPNRATRIAL